MRIRPREWLRTRRQKMKALAAAAVLSVGLGVNQAFDPKELGERTLSLLQTALAKQ